MYFANGPSQIARISDEVAGPVRRKSLNINAELMMQSVAREQLDAIAEGIGSDWEG